MVPPARGSPFWPFHARFFQAPQTQSSTFSATEDTAPPSGSLRGILVEEARFGKDQWELSKRGEKVNHFHCHYNHSLPLLN